VIAFIEVSQTTSQRLFHSELLAPKFVRYCYYEARSELKIDFSEVV
jgi:hypothetical protein